MLGQQVAENWNSLGGLIQISMPPLVDEEDRHLHMTSVLFSILKGELEVWIAYNEEKQERIVFTTIIQKDQVSRVRDLLIYSFTAVSRDLRIWEAEKVFDVLRRYASKNGCQSIIAYSGNEKVINFLASQGADVSYSLIKFEV